MPFLHHFWRRLLSDLGLVPLEMRSYEFDEKLIPLLQDLAEREQRSEGEVASDLLESAILKRHNANESQERWKSLSRRERDVVALACLGYTNSETAERLQISTETVKTHMRHAAGKLGVRTKTQLLLLLQDWDFSGWNTPTRKG